MKYPNKLLLTQFIVVTTFLLLINSCKKFVQINTPNNGISNIDVYSSNATAIAVLSGIYINMSQPSIKDGGALSVSTYCGLSADELTIYGNGIADVRLNAYYKNALNASIVGTPDLWSSYYQLIYVANAAIEGLSQSKSISIQIKQQLIGEAKFIRAFSYFYLTNLYGDVPLAINTDYKQNIILPRTPKAQIWQVIIADLKEAYLLLSDKYLDGTLVRSTSERVRPTKWAAAAMLSRSYLFTRDWVSAENIASVVINNKSLFNITSLDSTFLSNNNEAIWQLQPVNNGWNTEDAKTFVLPSTGPSRDWPIYLNKNLMDYFEPTDQRKIKWIGSVNKDGIDYFYPYKYKINLQYQPITEYSTILRLGEQYLIRAEARAQQGNISDAINDLNTIRVRAGLPETTASTTSTLLEDILHERQVELFSEWGHRWLDLKRTQNIDAIMQIVASQKGSTWSSNWQLYPITLNDILRDRNLTQNPGY
ncbi:MAG TPA: RagB/SusD family nutrient uptake outer membrane protein [Chitinophaga sp.]|uniref:RagB/SusD family nutrient uptake outer membrane protein n=1 Tax=Chitinophaga sp. TaxID=1869181 RepID=UPI002BF8C206|nr:RagB/SusD family nutrient uptake outer membrane protein [Chitinophaga sp.]HVI44926.1 RagB/SusD family nutrient uptake outer membrane protein [Chitinophaga sp.]